MPDVVVYRCADCRHFHANEEAVAHPEVKQRGVCRRNSPNPCTYITLTNFRFTTVWPPVESDDFCGQFERRP